MVAGRRTLPDTLALRQPRHRAFPQIHRNRHRHRSNLLRHFDGRGAEAPRNRTPPSIHKRVIPIWAKPPCPWIRRRLRLESRFRFAGGEGRAQNRRVRLNRLCPSDRRRCFPHPVRKVHRLPACALCRRMGRCGMYAVDSSRRLQTKIEIATRTGPFSNRALVPRNAAPHKLSPIISRPISQRRISLVPAPISHSLASRSRRPVG